MGKLCSWHPLIDAVLPAYLFLTLFSGMSAFNIEQRLPIYKYGPEGSLFGLSLAQHHISRRKRPEDAVVLVGAPTNERDADEHERGIIRPGGLYKCAVTMDEECNRVIVTPREDIMTVNSSNQWLGVTVKSQKPGGKIVVCAHRYTLTDKPPESGWEAVIGRCFMLDNYVQPIKHRLSFIYEPCLGMTDSKGSYSLDNFGYCQVGAAANFADISTNSGIKEYVAFGAPGSMTWMGAFHASQLEPDILDPSANAYLWSTEVPDVKPLPKNSYLGSSLVSGQLLNTTTSFVSGAPRVNSTGAVVIFQKGRVGLEEKLQVREIILGEKIASRFGHEVQLVDVTGDGRLDLIVGAPQYYDREKKHGGAVYIYVNKGLEQIGQEPTQILYGNIDSSFGMSITSLGDINMDGADDIAVGAPGDDSRKGAIYIYNGDNSATSKGVGETPSQVIRASDLIGLKRNITGMGYSLSGGLDMDFNGYPDVAAGTLSDSVIIFQSRPIVNVAGSIFGPEKPIVLSGDLTAQSFEVKVCLHYTALPLTFDEEVKATCTVKLDTARLDTELLPRVSFSTNDTTMATKSLNMTLYQQSAVKDKCKKITVYLNDDIQDKLTAITLELSFSTPDLSPTRKRRQVDTIPVLTPIMNAAIQNMASTSINFAKACGSDEICESLLSMSAYYEILRGKAWKKLQRKNQEGDVVLKLGTEKQIGMVIDIQNKLPGEDAHQAVLNIYLPHVLQYRSIERISGSAADVHCDTEDGNQTFVKCSLGNPFTAQSDLRFRLKLSKNKSIYQATNFTVTLQLHTTSQQPGHDEAQSYKVIVQVEAQLTISGYPSKEQVKFGGFVIGESAVEKPADAGTIHSHHYEVTNTGTGPAENVMLHIRWPQSIDNGKWLFYLLESNVKDGKGNCSLPNSVNPLRLRYSAADRQKRETEGMEGGGLPVPKSSSKPPESAYKHLDCSSAECIEFECSLGTIKQSDVRFIELNAVLWNSTFLEEYEGVSEIQVQSSASVSIAQKNIKFSELSKLNSTVSTSVLSEVLIPPVQEVKWWIIVVASVAGLLLLVVLVLVLWKCGFFKRQKFGDYQKARRHKQASKKADERETLY